MGKLVDMAVVAIGVICVFFGTVVVLYHALFTVNKAVPVTVDFRPQWHKTPSLSTNPFINNFLLLLIFCGSHSLLARDSVKSALSFVIPPCLYRQFYFLVASLALILECYLWVPIPYLVWDLNWAPINYVFEGVFILGSLITTIGFFSLSPSEFIGIQSPLYRLLNIPGGDKTELIQSGAFRYVRHPMYTGVFLTLWSTPRMSVGHLLLSSVITLYTILAVKWFEEPALVKTFGSQYRQYQKRVPKYFPMPCLSSQHECRSPTTELCYHIIVAVKWFEEPALVKTFGSQYQQYWKRVPKYFPIC